jgi:hypothetical protein
MSHDADRGVKDRDGKPGEFDRLESLVNEALQSVGVTSDVHALVVRVMESLPSVEEIRPALRPALRVLFGVTAAFFAVAAWAMDLTKWLGATGRVAQVSLGLIFFGAAMGAAAMAASLVRETGPKAVASLRAVFSGQGAKQLAATVGAAVLLGAVWVFLGWFPKGIIGKGLAAARASTAALSVVLVVAASVQMAILLRGTGSKQALRLVEAAGLVTAAVACAANYVIFVA